MFLEVDAPLGVLGATWSRLPERTEIEFERTASIPDRGASSLRISRTGNESLVAGIRDSPFVERVSFVGETKDGRFYHLRWGDTLPELLVQVRDADGTLLSAIAKNDAWTFELRFPEQAAASRFFTRYDDSEHPITIQSSSPSDSSKRAASGGLTSKQRDALKHAKEAGYFQVPRQTSLAELAVQLEISDSAVSQRRRRGVLNLLQEPTHSPVANSQTSLSDDD